MFRRVGQKRENFFRGWIRRQFKAASAQGADQAAEFPPGAPLPGIERECVPEMPPPSAVKEEEQKRRRTVSQQEETEFCK